MMTNSPLSVGSIQRMCEGRADPTEPLWLQVIQVKVVGHSDSTRYKYIVDLNALRVGSLSLIPCIPFKASSVLSSTCCSIQSRLTRTPSSK